MADNRMYLCYKPTGRIIPIGKRLGDIWYGAPARKALNAFFSECHKDWVNTPEADWDDFCLLTENDDWQILVGFGREGKIDL